MILTKELLQQLYPNGKKANLSLYVKPLNDACEKYDINNKLRLGCFLATLAHESGELNRVIENLNYSAEQLLRTFKKKFDPVSAAHYAYKPEEIANYVYGGRNGNNASGDGWKYRGRGPIQTTFKNNYAFVSEKLDYDFVSDPDSLTKPGAGSYSSALYWYNNGLNKYADVEDMLTITKRVNGGTNGLNDRYIHYKRIKAILLPLPNFK